MLPGNRVVVDASVAAKWFLPDEEDVAQANSLLTQLARGSLILLAPDILWPEVSSAITVATLGRVSRLTMAAGERQISRCLNTDLDIYPSRDFMIAAFRLVHVHSCAIYDALYLALADHFDIPFITADRRFFQRVRHLPKVIWLGDLSLEL